MMIKRGFLRIFLLAIGFFMLASSSGMARPVQAPAETAVQARLPIVLKRFAFGNGMVTGNVINAAIPPGQPGAMVSEAQVCWGSYCVLSNSDGKYQLDPVASGYQILTASADGFVANDQDVYVIGNIEAHQDIAIIPEVVKSGLNYRILTTWDPRTCWPDPNGVDCWDNDLDVHMWMKEIDQEIEYHIGYYFHYNPISDIEEYWLDFGDCRGFPNACLERDARYGFGPETIAIRQSELSIYYFGVTNFNQGNPGVPPISQTSAKVRLYGITGLVRKYEVPVYLGDKNFWYIFSLDGSNGEVTDQNCIIDYTNDFPVCP